MLYCDNSLKVASLYWPSRAPFGSLLQHKMYQTQTVYVCSQIQKLKKKKTFNYKNNDFFFCNRAKFLSNIISEKLDSLTNCAGVSSI